MSFYLDEISSFSSIFRSVGSPVSFSILQGFDDGEIWYH